MISRALNLAAFVMLSALATCSVALLVVSVMQTILVLP
jgi:hypothetical protein